MDRELQVSYIVGHNMVVVLTFCETRNKKRLQFGKRSPDLVNSKVVFLETISFLLDCISGDLNGSRATRMVGKGLPSSDGTAKQVSQAWIE